MFGTVFNGHQRSFTQLPNSHTNFMCGSKAHRRFNVKLRPIWSYKPTDFRRYLIEKKMRTLREYSLSTKRSISVQPKEPTHRCTLSVGTQFAGSNIDALRLAIQDLGFNEVTEEQERDITWNSAYFFKKDKSRGCFVNKFPAASLPRNLRFLPSYLVSSASVRRMGLPGC
uniref:Ribosomal_L16 domain-containing protein n=1 Tax=Mesocestoides corti TaxID=53468 RepID=A0A5K3EMN1_MESCO